MQLNAKFECLFVFNFFLALLEMLVFKHRFNTVEVALQVHVLMTDAGHEDNDDDIRGNNTGHKNPPDEVVGDSRHVGDAGRVVHKGPHRDHCCKCTFCK